MMLETYLSGYGVAIKIRNLAFDLLFVVIRPSLSPKQRIYESIHLSFDISRECFSTLSPNVSRLPLPVLFGKR